MTDTDPRVRVAQNLTAITHLAEHLLTQAVHSANDRELPGGAAMVALGPVANPTEYAENIDAQEWRHNTDPDRFPAADTSHEDDSLDAIVWALWLWSDEWRTARGFPLEGRQATVVTEAGFIRGSLDWAWDTLNVVEWEAFAKTVKDVRRRLEDILHDGDRAELGVACPSCEPPEDASPKWKPPRLILKHRDDDPTGRGDEYRCPAEWQHRWTTEDYRRWVGAVYVAHADALTASQIQEFHGIPASTIRRWASKRRVDEDGEWVEKPPLLKSAGRSHDGRKLYSVKAVVALRGEDGRVA